MAAKKIRNEIESVRSEIRELAEAVWALRDQLTAEQAAAAAERQRRSEATGPDGHATGRDALAAVAVGGGTVSLSGVFAPPDGEEGRAYRWSLREQPVADLLAGPAEAHAQVLAAIGHRQRLAILLHLLARPSTAAEMVAELSLGTTGAAYHHLNVLQTAGLVEQRQRGRFALVPARVPVLVSILAALSGAIDMAEIGPIHPSPSADGLEPGAAGPPKAKKGKKASG